MRDQDGFAAPLTRGEASGFFASGGFAFEARKKQTPRSPRLRGGHAPLNRGTAPISPVEVSQ